MYRSHLGFISSVCAVVVVFKATVSGGVLALVGLGAAQTQVPLVTAALKELDIRGVLRYSAGW